MFPFEEYVSGRTLQAFMVENADFCAYLAFAYLGMVSYGPAIARRVFGENTKGPDGKPSPDPNWLKNCMVVWNCFLASFSLFGAVNMVPPLLASIRDRGMHNTVCQSHDELNYATACGSWTGLFVLSKVPELVDTLILVIQKKKTPPFLHWYHHTSVLVFAWMSYSLGNSTMPVFGSMNIVVHTVMYTYFMICAMGYKNLVRRYAVFITLIQILQMVGGSVLTFYSVYVNYNDYYVKGNDDMDMLPCQVNRQTAVFGALMYLSYLYLFSKMFISSYLVKPSPRRANKIPAGAGAEGNGKAEAAAVEAENGNGAAAKSGTTRRR